MPIFKVILDFESVDQVFIALCLSTAYYAIKLSRPFLPGGSNLTSVNEIVEV